MLPQNSLATGFVLLSVFVSGCGGSGLGGSGTGTTPLPDAPKSGDENAGASAKFWISDVSEEKLPPCAPRETLAFGKCIDAVHFSDDLSVMVSGPTGSFSLAKPGAVVTEIWNGVYVHKDGSGDYEKLIHDRLAGRSWNGDVVSRYFLPNTIEVLSGARAGNVPRFVDITIKLSRDADQGSEDSVVYLQGDAVLCGKRLILPLRQEQIEEACSIQIGDASEVRIETKEGWITFTFQQLWSVLTPRPNRLSERPVLSLNFGYRPPQNASPIAPQGPANAVSPAFEIE